MVPWYGIFVCLFRSQAIHSCKHPQGSGFLRARPFVLPPQGQSCSDFGEVHAGYESVAGTEIIARTSASGSFKSEYDFVHVRSDCTRPWFILSSEGVGNKELSFFPKGTSRWFVQFLKPYGHPSKDCSSSTMLNFLQLD